MFRRNLKSDLDSKPIPTRYKKSKENYTYIQNSKVLIIEPFKKILCKL